jgi:hypothetical protein
MPPKLELEFLCLWLKSSCELLRKFIPTPTVEIIEISINGHEATFTISGELASQFECISEHVVRQSDNLILLRVNLEEDEHKFDFLVRSDSASDIITSNYANA